VIAGLSVVAAGLLWLGSGRLGSERGGRVAVLSFADARIGWSMPSPVHLGQQAAGMFGALPHYLAVAGFEMVSVPTEVSDADLAGFDVILIANPEHPLSADSQAAIWRFVERGGGLLALGDHTNLGGLMIAYRDLLAPIGVEFRFDSAFSFNRRWDNNVAFAPHPVTRGAATQEELQIGTGASLAWQPPARPVVWGRYAFSDAGDWSNTKRDDASGKKGAFLGDYDYQPTEMAGDLAVVVEATRGAGRVLVFGDTSHFQNPCLPWSFAFVRNVFQYLAHGSPPDPRSSRLGLLGFGAALIGLLGLSHRRSAWSAAVAAGLVATLAIPLLVLRRAEDRAPSLARERPIAFFDVGHLNAFDRAFWNDTSINGFVLNLLRAGFLPIVTRGPVPVDLSGVGLYVSLAPRRAFDDSEVARLRDFLDQGGAVLLAAGWEQEPAVRPFLAELGARLDPMPLGSIAPRWETPDDVVFSGAWKLTLLGPEWRALLQSFDYPVAATRRVGRGEVLIVADGYTFHDENLEKEKEFHRPNVDLLQTWLGALARGEAAALPTLTLNAPSKAP